MATSENAEPRGSRLPWVLWLLTLATALAGGYLAWQRTGAAAQQRDAAVATADSWQKEAKEAQTKAQGLEARLGETESQRAQLASKTEELASSLEEKEAEIARLTATYEALQDKMQEEIKKGDIRLSQSGGRIQVDLVDKILFDSGKAEVSERGKDVLARIGAVLATMEDRQIQVSGHTDDSPITNAEIKAKYDTNWELSAARAVNVVRFLQDTAKVPPSRLVAAAHSQYQPIASNRTPKGRAQNRRIEILLLPALQARKAGPLPIPDGGVAKGGK